jgi:ABC-type glycerol-3-phosphate transport system substrate-binding protein
LGTAGQGTAIPTAEATPTNAQSLVLWWPEALAPADSPDVIDLLNQHIGAFDTAEESNIDIEFRLKRYQDAGGIMSTLRTASAVAPGALPDLTLIRREELVAAVQAGLVYPLEGFVSSAIIGDLYDPALALGQVDGQIYGLPYMLDVLLLVYRTSETDSADSAVIADWTFNDILSRGNSIVFPAGQVTGVNNTFYLQYLAAGGTPPRSDGTMRLNEEALLTTLEFYEQSHSLGLIDSRVFDYTNVSDYQPALALGEYDAAIVNSSMYLSLSRDEPNLRPAPIPNASGQPISIVNGWMWVVTTGNLDRQSLTSRFLNWMMDTSSQREYAEAIHMLPSQRSALHSMGEDVAYLDLMDEIVANAIIPPPENAGGTLARAMQNALNAVLSGETTAVEATQAIINQMTD